MGGMDILVDDAGTSHMPSAIEKVSEADFDKVFAKNCKSVLSSVFR